jgi:hypothetical protein
VPTRNRRLEEELQSRRLTYFLRHLTYRLFDALQPLLIFGGLVILIALQIPWLSGPLQRIGLRGGTGELASTLLALVLVAIYVQVRSIENRLGDRSSDNQHLSDPMDVYPVLLDRATKIVRRDEKVLDVLGLSLYTAWPSIGFWLNRSELRGWTIRLAAPANLDGPTAERMPADWLDESRRNLTSAYTTGNSPMIKSAGIVVQPFGYDFLPFLHGFRLGNGDLFYSMLMWGSDGRLSRDEYSYTFVPHEDGSASAEAIRQVFDAWFIRACRDPWVPGASAP